MGHYRARRMVRPRPPGELTIEQLTAELAEARRKIVQYAAIIAYQESELKRLRKSMCSGCVDRHDGCGHSAGRSH